MPELLTAHAPSPTRADVVHLIGDLDQTAVTAILTTKASYLEIQEAVKWAIGDAEELGKQGREMTPTIEAVYDILVADPVFALEPEEE